MQDWQQSPIFTRADGSYVVTRQGNPYHVPRQGEWMDLWAQVDAWAREHPDQTRPETVRPGLTPEKLAERHAAAVRMERDRRLAASDYVLMPDYPVADGKREAVERYRRDLRELPEQPGFPWDGGDGVPWPPRPW